MQSLDGSLVFSATDLSSFLACPHLTLLNRHTALGGPKPRTFDDPGLAVLRQHGQQHEQHVLARLTTAGAANVEEIKAAPDEVSGADRYTRLAAATAAAMRAGKDIIYQACLFDGSWLGFADFLRRVERPSKLGGWSYEVIDAKLAREAKAGALLQVLLYADLLKGIQGMAPEYVHLALGGPEAPFEEFRVKDYAAYFRSIRRRFLDWVAGAPAELPRAVDPVPHCDICLWESSCTQERRDVDHLSFVAGISRQQQRALVTDGVTTLAALGDLDLTRQPRIDGITPAGLTRIHNQARIQLAGRRQDKKLYELVQTVVPDQGLAALPEPSPGDLFVDLEGDPYALELGIEYLFGVVDMDGKYVARWSLDRTTERQTFEWFMDFVTGRLKQHPTLHVYHYAAYEPTAFKRLAGRYDTRIEELDRLLRGKVFVDLYRVVAQGLRASVESYSIKKMEVFYGFERTVDLRQATSALANFEAWLQLGGSKDEGAPLLQAIEGYNRDDCLSTLRLRDWLESLRPELASRIGHDVPRLSAPSAEPTEELSERLQEVHALMGRLLAGVPEDAAARSREQHARWILAQLLEYHRREAKSTWWRYFHWREMSER